MSMGLPATLHGQLYLLSVDRGRRRVHHHNRVLVGMALRAATLTDLYLQGHLEDRNGAPARVRPVRPGDAVLATVLDHVEARGYSGWATAIEHDAKQMIVTVGEQLKSEGWIRLGRAIPGVTSARVTLADETAVAGLSERVGHALGNAIEGMPAEPIPLAVGLLGVLGQLPTVFSFKDEARHHRRLQALIQATIEPILGLHESVLRHFETRQFDTWQA